MELARLPSFSQWGRQAAERCWHQIESLGGECRVVGNGFESNPVNAALVATIFSDSFPGRFTPTRAESALMATKQPRVGFIVDLDGVVFDPCQYAWGLVRGEMADSYSTLMSLARLTRLSSCTTIWTSRFYFSPERESGFLGRIFSAYNRPIPGYDAPGLRTLGITRFPFLNVESIWRLEGLSERKIVVETNKPLVNPAGVLGGILKQQHQRDKLVYYIGSSGRDRQAVIGCLEENRELAETLIYLDTGHWQL